MSNECEFVVVGGGILGLSHVLHLVEAGKKVKLIEKNNPIQGASVRNFGQIVPSGFSSKWQKYGIESLKIYERIHNEFDLKIKREGSLYVASNEEEMTLLKELHVINEKNGYTSIQLSPAECIDRLPTIRSQYVASGLLFPQELVAEPVQTLNRLRQYLIECHKVEIIATTAVSVVTDNQGNALVQCANGKEIIAAKAIVCPGHDLEVVIGKHSPPADLQWVKLQMIELQPMSPVIWQGSLLTGRTIRRYEAFTECPSFAAIKKAEDPKDILKSYGIHLLFKQTFEGTLIVGDSHEYADFTERDTLSTYNNRHDINELMLEEMHRILSLDSYKIVRTWNGIYSQCKSSGIWSKQIEENVHLVTAIGGKGMTASLGWAAEHVSAMLL